MRGWGRPELAREDLKTRGGEGSIGGVDVKTAEMKWESKSDKRRERGRPGTGER